MEYYNIYIYIILCVYHFPGFLPWFFHIVLLRKPGLGISLHPGGSGWRNDLCLADAIFASLGVRLAFRGSGVGRIFSDPGTQANMWNMWDMWNMWNMWNMCYIHCYIYIYIYIIVVLCLSLLLSLLLLVLNYIWLLHLWVILWRVIQSGFRRWTGGFNQQ